MVAGHASRPLRLSAEVDQEAFSSERDRYHINAYKYTRKAFHEVLRHPKVILPGTW